MRHTSASAATKPGDAQNGAAPRHHELAAATLTQIPARGGGAGSLQPERHAPVLHGRRELRGATGVKNVQNRKMSEVEISVSNKNGSLR